MTMMFRSVGMVKKMGLRKAKPQPQLASPPAAENTAPMQR